MPPGFPNPDLISYKANVREYKAPGDLLNQKLLTLPRGRCLIHEACLSIFEESGCFCYMHHMLFWRSKIRITTRTGTLRSSYHSSLARAQTSGKASPGTSNTNLLVQGLVTQHPRAYSYFQFGREVLLLFVSVSLNLCVIANSKNTIDVSIPL